MLVQKFIRGVLVLAVVVAGSTARAQLPQTRLYAVAPSGGQVGQTVELRVTAGDDLEEVDKLIFSHPGITAAPKTPGQFDNTFVVTIAADVPIGLYDVRCGGLFGVSNPRRFVVGQRKEVAETENNKPDPVEPQPLELNTVINGKMDGGTDIDWFKFSATKGQRITFDCWAERIDSKMDATLAIYDASGRRPLKTARDTKGSDPVLLFEVPADGEYLVKLHDHTFGNGNDYVYRLEAHTAPQILFAVPPAGEAGTTATITLYGINLPGGQRIEDRFENVTLEKVDVAVAVPQSGDLLDVDGRVRGVAAGTDAFSYRLDSPQGLSAPIRLGIARTPVVREQEPNDIDAQAQKIGMPVEVGGQFGVRGDSDSFRFEAKAGEVLWIEAYAQRMGTMVDPFVAVDQVVVDAEGKETLKRLGTADDDATNLLQNVFETKTDDPKFKLAVPADGWYQVTIRDRYWETRGDASLVYRLAIRRESPNFRLVAVPSAPTAGQVWPVGLRQGDTFGINVLAFRQDDFDGPINVTLEGLPGGVTCAGTTISSKENMGLLVFETTADAQPGWHMVKITGTAQIDNPVMVRAEDAASKAIPEAEKALPALRKALDDLQPKLQQAKDQLAETEKALVDKPDDEGLKKQKEQRMTALQQVQTMVDDAAAKLAQQEKVIADAKAALAAATEARKQAVSQVSHVARTGTVVWPTANNQPAVSRVSEGFEFSIMPEQAYFQLSLEGSQFEANQSRQLLIPVKLAKRNEFNEKVQLNAAGMPKGANIDAPNIAIEKDQSEQYWRLFVKDNAPPGTYAVWLTSTGQVAYRRNPAKAERLKAAHEAVKAEVEALKTTAAEATKVKTEATAKATQAQQTLQTAQADQTKKQQEKQQADQGLTQAKQVREQADTAFAAADKELQGKEAELKTLEEQVVTADAAVKQAESDLKVAQDALAADPENAEKKTAVEKSQQALTAAQQKLAEVTKARDLKKTERDASKQKRDTAEQAAKQAAEKQTVAEAAQKTADEALAVAVKAATDADTANKTAQEAKTKSEQDEKAANDAAANKEKERAAAEKAATDADNAAKPKNANFTPPSTPVIITVKPAPIKLTAEVPNGGAMKAGEKLEIKVKVARQNGFAGPVQVTFPATPGVAGISSDALTIAADQAEGVLTLTAAADAAEGQPANTVLRAEMDFEGKAAVDAPITIKVNK